MRTEMGDAPAAPEPWQDEVPSLPAAQRPTPPRPETNVCEWCAVRRYGPMGRRLLRCAMCLDAMYCSRACQRAAWRSHRMECGARTRFVSKTSAVVCGVCEDAM